MLLRMGQILGKPGNPPLQSGNPVLRSGGAEPEEVFSHFRRGFSHEQKH